MGTLRWDGKAWRRWNGRRWAKAPYSPDRMRLTLPMPLREDPTIPHSRREHLLAQAVAAEVASGADVVLPGSVTTVVGRRRRVSHLVHALLTLLTMGMWAVVWIAMCLARTRDRVRLEVDEWGHVWGVEGNPAH